MEFPILNKFEKHDLVIKLCKEGKTYSEIAHIAHVSLRDIKPILKKYEQKLKTKKGENNPSNQNIKKLSNNIIFFCYTIINFILNLFKIKNIL